MVIGKHEQSGKVVIGKVIAGQVVTITGSLVTFIHGYVVKLVSKKW